jgi:DNA-binding NtrC family response regulator
MPGSGPGFEVTNMIFGELTKRLRVPASHSRDVHGAERLGRGRIRVLLIENVGGDADSFGQELEGAQFKVCRGHGRSAEELATRCLEQPYDAIVCDMTTGRPIMMEALALVRQRDSNIPFIVLINTPGVDQTAQEDILTECMLRGATDCVDRKHLSALPVAVAFAVEQRILTEQRDQIEHELERARARYEARLVVANDVE